MIVISKTGNAVLLFLNLFTQTEILYSHFLYLYISVLVCLLTMIVIPHYLFHKMFV